MKLKTLGLLINIQNINNVSCMFNNCYSLEIIQGLESSFSSKNKVYDMSGMFSYCKSLKNIDLYNFKTKYETNISSMFSNCSSLEYYNISYINANNLGYIFYNCKNLKKLDLPCFNKKKSNSMSHMFESNSFSELHLSLLDTSNVIDMSYMFYDCVNLKNIKFGHFLILPKLKT